MGEARINYPNKNIVKQNVAKTFEDTLK